MNIISGDFIGFTYGDYHSSDLNIIRTSDGDRYDENLTPPIQDHTIEVPGGDGEYLFRSNYSSRPFTIPIAFNSLTQSQFYNLRVIFGDSKGGRLIFDESPYKYYFVKPSNPLELNYISFDEEGERIYKGEGTIHLVAYNPFARSRYKYREEYNYENIPAWRWGYNYNLSEWLDESGIRYRKNLDLLLDEKIQLWNPGVKESDYILKIPFTEQNIDGETQMAIPQFHLSIIDDSSKQLLYNPIIREDVKDAAIQINTKLNLVEGVNEEGKVTGSVYNRYEEGGYYFKIPFLDSEMSVKFKEEGGDPIQLEGVTIDYDYLYY